MWAEGAGGEGKPAEAPAPAELPSAVSPPAASSRPASTKGKRPAWALTEDEAEQREDQEEDNLLDFALGLDIDEFLTDLDDKEREEASRIISDLQENERRAAATEAESASEAGQGGSAAAAWKAQFVTAVNAAAGRDLLEQLKLGKARRTDPDAQSAMSRASTTSRATEASHLKARLGAEKREEVEAAAEGRAKEGKFVSASAADNEAEKAKFRLASEALGQKPRLRDVHSPASVREMIQQEHAKLALLSPIKED